MMRFRRPARPDGLTDFHLADFLDDEADVAAMLELQDDESGIKSVEAAATQARARWAAEAAYPDLTPQQLAAISDAVRQGGHNTTFGRVISRGW